MVCSMTRGPAKPMSAPGSASVMSPRLAKLAVTPPVVGWVSTLMYNPPLRLNRSSAALVLAIAIMVLGVVLVLNPFGALVMTVRVLGAVILVDGLTGLWVSLILKKNF